MDTWRVGGAKWIVGALLVVAGCGGTSTAADPSGSETINANVTSEEELIDDAVVALDGGSALAADCANCDRHANGRRRAVRGVLPGSDNATCLYGTSDARGDVALGFGDLTATWDFYDRDGDALATIASSDVDWLQGDAYPDAAGFQIPIWRINIPVHGALFIGAWTLDGTKIGEQFYSSLSPFLVDSTRSPMPRGGAFASSLRISPGPINVLSADVRWIGPASELLGSRSFIVRTPLVGSTGGSVDTRGHTLAWFPGDSGLDAQWLDIGGRQRGPQFPSPLPDGAVLAPLIGGGFAVRDGDDWVATIASDRRRLEPAPRWLASRPRTQLVILDHDEGYALLIDDGETAPPRSQAIELRSPWGAWLGRLVLASPHGDVRGQRTRVGRDGTVVQLLTEGAGASTQCAYRFWPRILH